MGRSACTRRIMSKRSSDSPWAGWRRGGPRSSVSLRPGQHSAAPAAVAATPFPAADDGSIALASWCLLKTDEPVISLGLGSLSTVPMEGSEHRKTQYTTSALAARSLLSVHVAIMDLNIPGLSFRRLRVRWVTPILVPQTSSSDALLTRSLSEQNAVF